jgi:hypothetical protein
MKLDSAYAERLELVDLGDLVICDLRAIDHRSRTRSVNLELAFTVKNDRGVFIDTDT